MSPSDINIKILTDSNSFNTSTQSEQEDCTIGFNNILSAQLGTESEEAGSGTKEFADSVNKSDSSPSLDLRDSVIPTSMLSSVNQMLYSERLTQNPSLDYPNSQMIYTKEFSRDGELDKLKFFLPSSNISTININENLSGSAYPETNIHFPSKEIYSGADTNLESSKIEGKKTSLSPSEKLTASDQQLSLTVDKLASMPPGLMTVPLETKNDNIIGLGQSIATDLNSLLLTSSAPAPGVIPTYSNPLKLDISTPITHLAWGERMVQQIRQLSLEGIGLAMIQVTPQELGPIMVEIALNQNEAIIHFSAQHQETRDILSQHMNRLKESFTEVGLQLQSATTGSYSDGQTSSFFQQNTNSKNHIPTQKDLKNQAAPHESENSGLNAIQSPRRIANSKVDLFA